MIEEISLFDSDDTKRLNQFPVYFFKSYKEFVRNYYYQDLICLYHADLNAYAVFKIRKSKYWQFAQLLHRPLKPGSELNLTEEQQYLTDSISYLKHNLKIDKIEQGDILGFTQHKPANSKYCEFGTYEIDLSKYSNENLLKSLHERTARYVKSVNKEQLVLKSGLKYLDDFYSVYKMTSEHTGMYTDDFNYFKSAADILGSSFCNALVAYKHTEPIASLFMMHTPYKLCVTHTGTNRNSEIHGAVRWLHYQNMLEALKKDITYYDLMGVRINSKHKHLKGVFQFKKRFGGDLKQGYLWKVPLRPLHLLPYQILYWTRNTLAGVNYKDIIDQES